MSPSNRRQFLVNASKALGGLTLVQATPILGYAIKSPVADLIHRSTLAMGTSVRVSLPKAVFTSSLAEDAFRALSLVDTALTAHHAESDLMRMNSSTGIWMKGRELVSVAKAARNIGALSDGALDVTVLPAMRKYGFIPGVTSDLDRIDFTKLEVEEGRVRISESGYGADFGGIAKGFGVDEAVQSLRSQGVDTALVDAGGDLYALGRPDQDRRWAIGILHPLRENDLIATLEVENEAVATSGTYVQRRVVDGREVNHLIHPSTGESVQHVLSATIVAGDAMTADGLATATSIMQRDAAQSLIDSLPGVEGYWIYADGTQYASRGLRSRLTLL